jgi:hypothetical protein
MSDACEESSGVLYARCDVETRFLYQDAIAILVLIVPCELLAACPSKWTFVDRGIFHITRRMARRPFRATLIADIRGARRRAANEN